jgi:hypothetical protein
MKTFFTKEKLTACFALHPEVPRKELWLEINYSKVGVARAYLGKNRLPFCAKGNGYDKKGVVLSNFLKHYAQSHAIIDGSVGVNAVISHYSDILDIIEHRTNNGGCIFIISSKKAKNRNINC